MKGRFAELRQQHNDRAWLAWHVAYLPRGKHPVKLQKLLMRERVVQTPEQMLAIAKSWTLALGGKIEGRPN